MALDHRPGESNVTTNPSRLIQNFAKCAGDCSFRLSRLGVLVLLVGLLGPIACASPAPPPPLNPQVAYRVGAPDQIQISILPEPRIERILRVRPDGKVSLDLIGDVQASGKTTEEIAEAVRVAIGRYKRDSSVTVTVIAAEADTISLFGAIAQLGGTTHFASTRYIRVIRTDTKKTVVHDVNLARIWGGDLSTNMQLMSGDIIVVPPTTLAKIGSFLQQLLFPFQPLIEVGRSYGGVTSVPGI